MARFDQFGFGVESTFGTAVSPTRFIEVLSAPVKVQAGRIPRRGLRAGRRAEVAGTPFTDAVSVSVEAEVMNKGFGLPLKLALGAVSTAGPTDSAYTHTFTVPTSGTDGLSATIQNSLTYLGTATQIPQNVAGCKVKSLELSCKSGDVLTAKWEFDGVAVNYSSPSLATASYATGLEQLTSLSGSCTIDGTTVQLKDWSVKLENPIKTDRRKIGSGTRQEQITDGMVQVTFSATLDFTALTNQNVINATTAAGTTKAVVLSVKGLTLIGSTTYPELRITIPACQFDGDSPELSDKAQEEKLTGRGTDDGTSGSPITIAYITADSTP